MTPKSLDYTARVAFVRDAQIFPSLDTQTMDLHAAIEAAISGHRHGEYPVIVGTKLHLVGIEAIRAARAAQGNKSGKDLIAADPRTRR